MNSAFDKLIMWGWLMWIWLSKWSTLFMVLGLIMCVLLIWFLFFNFCWRLDLNLTLQEKLMQWRKFSIFCTGIIKSRPLLCRECCVIWSPGFFYLILLSYDLNFQFCQEFISLGCSMKKDSVKLPLILNVYKCKQTIIRFLLFSVQWGPLRSW